MESRDSLLARAWQLQLEISLDAITIYRECMLRLDLVSMVPAEGRARCGGKGGALLAHACPAGVHACPAGVRVRERLLTAAQIYKGWFRRTSHNLVNKLFYGGKFNTCIFNTDPATYQQS